MSLIDANDKTLKKRRNYVKSACIPCRKAHTACDETKPCSRCISRGIPHLCIHEDEEEISKQVPEEKGALRFEIHDSFAESQRKKPKKKPRDPNINTTNVNINMNKGTIGVPRGKEVTQSPKSRERIKQSLLINGPSPSPQLQERKIGITPLQPSPTTSPISSLISSPPFQPVSESPIFTFTPISSTFRSLPPNLTIPGLLHSSTLTTNKPPLTLPNIPEPSKTGTVISEPEKTLEDSDYVGLLKGIYQKIDNLESEITRMETELDETKQETQQLSKTCVTMQKQLLYLLHQPNSTVEQGDPAVSVWEMQTHRLIDSNPKFQELLKFADDDLKNHFHIRNIFPDFFLPFAFHFYHEMKFNISQKKDPKIQQLMYIQNRQGEDFPVITICTTEDSNQYILHFRRLTKY
jgi:hypothetical protein